MLQGYRPAQIAYHVPDVEEAAARHSAMYGSGPFFYAHNVPIKSCNLNGQEVAFDHSAAFGQWGDLMVEFLTVHTPPPNLASEVFGSAEPYGLHHLAFIVDDPAAIVSRAKEDENLPLTMHVVLDNGLEAFFIDTRALSGHLTEIYAPSPQIMAIYDFVRDQSVGFDGRDPVRPFSIG